MVIARLINVGVPLEQDVDVRLRPCAENLKFFSGPNFRVFFREQTLR